LSVGELVAFNILAGRVNAPVLRLAQIWQDFHQARLSVLRLGDILNTTAEPTYTVGRARLPAIRGNINFDHVTFRYRLDGQEVLHDVTFDVPAGQIVGIVGPSGSGKSTVTKLVQRLYVPESGRVLVDGHGSRHGRPGVAAPVNGPRNLLTLGRAIFPTWRVGDQPFS